VRCISCFQLRLKRECCCAVCDPVQCRDDDRANNQGTTSSVPSQVRRSASSRLCHDSNDDNLKTSQRASRSQPPSIAEPTPRRSSVGLRSSFRELAEEGTEVKEKELDDKGAELANMESAITPDPLSRKSSEGLRWINKLEDKETELRGSTKELEDEEAKLPQKESEGELRTEKPEVRGSEIQVVSLEDGDNFESIADVSASSEKHVRSSLPSPPPSLIDRQCLIVVCFSTCLLFLLSILVVVIMYHRWVATHTLATPISDGDPNNGRQQLDDISGSGCDSLFSFSHCADSDMFG